MNESELTQCLDERGWLADAKGEGCYSLALDVPSSPTAIRDRWHSVYDVPPQTGLISRLMHADRVLYVGHSTHVYGRLCDHVNRRVRQAGAIRVFPVSDVHGIWPDHREFNLAASLAGDGTLVASDGDWYGP